LTGPETARACPRRSSSARKITVDGGLVGHRHGRRSVRSDARVLGTRFAAERHARLGRRVAQFRLADCHGFPRERSTATSARGPMPPSGWVPALGGLTSMGDGRALDDALAGATFRPGRSSRSRADSRSGDGRVWTLAARACTRASTTRLPRGPGRCRPRTGVVTVARWLSGYGTRWRSGTSSAHSTLYAHLSAILVRTGRSGSPSVSGWDDVRRDGRGTAPTCTSSCRVRGAGNRPLPAFSEAAGPRGVRSQGIEDRGRCG
jgi:hypothetical protein